MLGRELPADLVPDLLGVDQYTVEVEDDRLDVARPVTWPCSGRAKSEPGKDVGSVRADSMCATEDTAWRSFAAVPGPGGGCRSRHLQRDVALVEIDERRRRPSGLGCKHLADEEGVIAGGVLLPSLAVEPAQRPLDQRWPFCVRARGDAVPVGERRNASREVLRDCFLVAG